MIIEDKTLLSTDNEKQLVLEINDAFITYRIVIKKGDNIRILLGNNK